MAVDLSCYSALGVGDTESALQVVKAKDSKLFGHKFLISNVRGSTATHKEIALEHGTHAKSFFLVSLNDKSAAPLVSHVADEIRAAFGAANVLILHGNSKVI
jgi:hypothetical protein